MFFREEIVKRTCFESREQWAAHAKKLETFAAHRRELQSPLEPVSRPGVARFSARVNPQRYSVVCSGAEKSDVGEALAASREAVAAGQASAEQQREDGRGDFHGNDPGARSVWTDRKVFAGGHAFGHGVSVYTLVCITTCAVHCYHRNGNMIKKKKKK